MTRVVAGKTKVPVEWVYAKRPDPTEGQPTVLAAAGHQLLTGFHTFTPEGVPTKRIWCDRCRRYFRGWHAAFLYHKVARQKGTKS